MPTFHYVYILVSDAHPDRHYTGVTSDLSRRLLDHNTGRNRHTAKYRPWRMEIALAFRSKEKAIAFELYLKSHSGRAFASKHF